MAATYRGECLCHGVVVSGPEKYRTRTTDILTGESVPVIQVRVPGLHGLHDIPVRVAELVPAPDPDPDTEGGV